MDRYNPNLVLIGSPDPEDLSVDQIVAICKDADLPVYLYQPLRKLNTVASALKAGVHGIIDSHESEQLLSTVTRDLKKQMNESRLYSSEKKLEEIEHRYQLLLESARDAIAYIHQGLHIYANRSYLEMFGKHDFSELEGTSILELMTIEAGASKFKKLLRQIDKGKMPEDPITAKLAGAEGSDRDLIIEFLPARYNGEQCTQLQLKEQVEQQVLAEEIRKLRQQDPLTQLMNRAAFIQRLDSAIPAAREGRTPTAVMRIEIDNFDALVEEVGLNKSDRVISSMADILRDCTNRADVCARYQDATFAVFLNRKNKADAESVAKDIIRKQQDCIIDLGETSITATCSIGMEFVGKITESAEEVLTLCASALREADELGGNCLVRYRPKLGDDAAANGDRQWVERIRHALNSNEIQVIQQPVVDLESETEPFHEASTQIQENDKILLPAEYMPYAERNDLGSAIDRMILPMLMDSLTNPARTDDVNTYFVTISGNSILDFSFSAWLRNLLHSASVAGRRLVLQMPASFVSGNIKPAQRLIEELSESGCRFSISELTDDRRTLQTLNHTPVQFGKLSSELSLKLATGKPAVIEKVRNVVSACDNRSISLIAGGIEDATHLAAIWQCGVKLVQGDFLKTKSRVIGLHG
jgi:diguanylate cyclase (GGDEF)-like protein/PAS domain S-box-containing protein